MDSPEALEACPDQRRRSTKEEGIFLRLEFLFVIRIFVSVAIFAVNFSLERLEHVQQMKLALLSHLCHLRPEVRVVAILV
jgi:hypothetical protein